MERIEIIKKYEKIKQSWDNDEELKRILPDTYSDIYWKLEGLKAGCDYIVTNKTSELKSMIAYVGGQISRCNYKADNQLININNGITWNKATEIAKLF